MTMTKKELVKSILSERKSAYERVFDAGNSVNPDTRIVLQDLEKFCRVKETTFHADARIHAALEGRREVMLRIHDYLSLNLEQLTKKYGGIDS